VLMPLALDGKKVCLRCKVEKPIGLFPCNRSRPDGLNLHCKDCVAEYYRIHRGQILVQKISYYQEHKNVIAARALDHRRHHKAEINVYAAAYREAHRLKIAAYREAHKVEIAACQAEDDRANPWKRNARSSKRRCSRRRQTPPWLSKSQLKEIESFFKLAHRLTALTGVRHVVDHIVPLQGKTVRGLHVPWNLRVSTWKENARKGNKFPFE